MLVWSFSVASVIILFSAWIIGLLFVQCAYNMSDIISPDAM